MPPEVVTVTPTGPVPAGEVAVSEVGEVNITLMAAVDAKVTSPRREVGASDRHHCCPSGRPRGRGERRGATRRVKFAGPDTPPGLATTTSAGPAACAGTTTVTLRSGVAGSWAGAAVGRTKPDRRG